MSEDLRLLADITIILVIAGAVVVLFHRLRLPVVLGYLIAGIIVGPYTPPFPLVRDTEIIKQLADIGIILLLLSLGLDFNFGKLRQVGVVAGVVAGLETMLTLFLVYGVGQLLGWSRIDSLFIAAALSISSTAIVVKILNDTGKSGLLSSRITFGILIVEDFAAVLLLVALSGIASSSDMNWGNVAMVSVRLVVLAAAAVVVGRIVVPWLLDRVARVHSQEILVVATLGLGFSMALVSNALGLSVAAGAFLAGAVLSESHHKDDIHRLLTPIRDLFGALFFVAMGMLIDVSLLGHYWAPVLLISVLAISAKVVFGFLGTYMLGYDARTSFRVGGALSQRGEFSLVIAKVGLDSRATGPLVYPVVAGVSLATSVVAPFLIHSADSLVDRIGHLAPSRVREFVDYTGQMFRAIRRAEARQSLLLREMRRGVSIIAINMLVIGLFLLGSSFVLDASDSLGRVLRLSPATLRAVIGVITIALCVPSAIVIWRRLATILNAIVESAPWSRTNIRFFPPHLVRLLLRNTISFVLLAALGVIAMPLMVHLVGSGLPMFLVLTGVATAAMVYLTWSALRAFHERIEALYREGLLGDDANTSSTSPRRSDGDENDA
ncbi:MAG: cation:proton antiporter [Chloroflexi bacterium]|nr:cation:proton antiporter [Chloroflexota bacterium]